MLKPWLVNCKRVLNGGEVFGKGRILRERRSEPMKWVASKWNATGKRIG
jgi:hypothetical protein